MKYRSILLFGPPGVGKGTQGKILGTVPNFFHFACGDAFRSLTVESELGRAFLDYSGRGELVPDEYTVRLWQVTIAGHEKLGDFVPDRDTLVLDGLPRNRNQAEILNDMLDVQSVFSLVCADREKLVQRLQRRALSDNRLDDANVEVIHRRLDTYELETKPVLEFYGDDLVHLIDATQSPAKVLLDVLNVVTRL
ncbi:MAG: nucleoside monophosphate kinase [Verrucomicrobia bacterium]|nr:nucleoside monophosphate kinase [Verrucomicrobiota bacterium]MCF7708532.1 nucleoside monophosphate kinase [Verrucomicrobiota bacterium]